MTNAGVVLDGAGLVLHAAHAHSERGVGLVSRDPFVFDTIKNMYFIKYYVLASITLLYFDHVITLPLEVRRVWSTRFTGASLLFLLNRYVPFFGYIPIMIGMFNPPWTSNVITLISNVISAIILILRTYALYNRALWVLLVTSFFGATSVVISAWSTSSVEGELFNFQPVAICVPMLFHDRGLQFAWIATFCFDFVVFGLTIARTYRFMKAQSRLHMRSHLTMLLMRDGSIYFLVMSIVNAANYILSTRIRNSFFASATGTNSVLANVISVTMISRLLLNLRGEAVQYNRRNSTGIHASSAQMSTDTNLIFTSRILGNLTAELDYEERPRGFRSGAGSENYYSYGYSGEESDEVYELQSRSTRSGVTARSGISGRTVSTDPSSSSGTGTFAGSTTGTGSGSGSDSDRNKEPFRERSRLARAPYVNTAISSMTARHSRGEPQTPAIVLNSNSGERSPFSLPPLSPETINFPPTLHHPSPQDLTPQSAVLRDRGREIQDSSEAT